MTGHAIGAPRSGRARWWGLAGFVAAVVVAAALGSVAAAGARSAYAALDVPAWAPPGWLFGPVWTVLYGMIAVAGWLVWRRHGWIPALTVYAVQLALNAAWTPLFFAAGAYGVALADILVLWTLIGVTVAMFWRLSRAAAVLLLPYWAWVTFASALNAAIWLAN